jgi:hypothetical protein
MQVKEAVIAQRYCYTHRSVFPAIGGKYLTEMCTSAYERASIMRTIKPDQLGAVAQYVHILGILFLPFYKAPVSSTSFCVTALINESI